MQIPDSSKPEDLAPIPGKFEAAQRRAKVDTFHQGKDLEAAAEHFRMKQRLQFAFGFARISQKRLPQVAALDLREDSRQKMMLIRKSGDAQPVCLRAVDNALPIDTHGDISFSD